MKHFLFVFPFLLLTCCTNNKEPKIEDQKSSIQYITFVESDTLKERNYIAIFNDKSKTKTELTQSELKTVNENLIKAVNEYNNMSEKQDKADKLNLQNYFRQYFVSTNTNGEKIVKVFCFCEHIGDDWRTERLDVHDGGKCYFNVVVNITRDNYDTLKIYGMA